MSKFTAELDILLLKMLGLAGFAETAGFPEVATSMRAIVHEAIEWRKHIIAEPERPSDEPHRDAK